MFFSLRLRLLESALDAPDRATVRRRPACAAHFVTGFRGKCTALLWLRCHGYTVVAHAWRSARAPDLIAWTAEPSGDASSPTLRFVEVKTRTTRAVAPAHLAVDEDKRLALRRLARHYLRRLPSRNVPTRFDILSIYFEK
ncbi:MAG TPA: YraN family protein [Acidobacteriaceae bacterium]|nr:YraN family protein [Acidobacteriaceae bacterium]